MNIELGTVKSSPFVGVFAVITDKIALLPPSLEAKERKQLEKLFEVELISTKLANSNLLGVLAAGNSKGFIVSEIIEESEVEALESKGLKIKKLPGLTAIGNLVECNDKKAFCSKVIGKKTRKEIEKTLNVECVETVIAESDLVGSSVVLTNKGFIVNPMASEKEFKLLKKETGVEGSAATANFGDKFIGNGIIANSNAALAGKKTTGHELIRIDEGLSGR